MARTRATDFRQKQQAILSSAAAVLAEHGIDRASMAQIAAQAGVSKALLYHYYPGRDALVFAIIRDHLRRLDAAIAAARAPGRDPEAQLGALIGAVLEIYRDADNEHQVQLGGTAGLGDDQRAEIQALERRIVRRFASVLRAVNPALDAAPRPLLMPVTMSLFGMMNWAYMWFRDDGPLSRHDYAALMTRLVLDGARTLPAGLRSS
ncbi:MAG: TetR/AcrR family transcriptional regulator [Rhodobacteraceae bacterium HLUCCA12]|nr:MAG: TetR/AcrR family transcriptional regulator [Rhodobacteraceae bacterium HLUCCA12]